MRSNRFSFLYKSLPICWSNILLVYVLAMIVSKDGRRKCKQLYADFVLRERVCVCMHVNQSFYDDSLFGNISDSKVFKGKCRERVSKINFHAAV